MEQHFRRQQLYDLVWSEPLTQLAPQFGMSDVALAKICKRNGIPIPGRGHWAKLKAGKTSPQFPLPPRGLGSKETIHIGASNWSEREDDERALMMEDVLPPPDFAEPSPDLFARITAFVGRVPQSRNLKLPHRAVAKLLAEDAERHERWRQSPYPLTFDQPLYVSPYEQRRLKLIDAVFKAMARVGMAPMIPREKNPEEFTVRIGDSTVRFMLGKPGEQRSSWAFASETHRSASEPMRLKVDWGTEKPEGLVFEWTDRPDTSLESMLQEIVVNLIAAGEMRIRAVERHWYEHRAKHKAALIEADQERREDAVRRERERQRRLENARIEKLHREAMSLRLADDIRRYVAAVNERNAASSNPVSPTQMDDWSRWALAQAERIDPVLTGAFLLPLPEDEMEEKDESESTVHTPPSDSVEIPPAWHPNRWYTR
jgi:hypothetical protein